ncbi:Non-structural protein NS1 [Nymphon striatum]|nr:Non-structural protein NS1 [Nymphon striatum]
MQIATFMAWMEATRNMYIKKSNGIVLEGPTNAGKTMILNTLLGTMELEPIPRTNDNSSFHLDQLIFATRVLFEEPCTIQALAGTDEHMTILLTKWMKLFVSKNGIVLASVDESYDIVTDKSVGLTPAMWVQMFTECEAIITTMPNKINDANELLSLDMHILADRHGFRPEYGQLDYSNLKRLIDKHCKGTIVIVNGEEKANVLRKYHQPTINAAVLGIPAWTSISMGYRTVAFMKIIAYYFLYFKIYVCLSYDLETSKNNFHYVNEFDFENTDPDGEIGYFFIVDLEYPHQIHDDTADFPLAPEHMLIDDSLLTDFMNVDLKYPHAIHDEIVDLPLAQEHMKIYDSLLTEYMTAQPNKEKPSEKLLLNQFDKIEYKHLTQTALFLETINLSYDIIRDKMSDYLDTSNYDHTHKYFSNKNRAKLGYIKDESCGYSILDAIFLKPKAYSLITENPKYNKMTCKGIIRGRHSSSIGEPTIPSALSEPIILDKTIPPTRKRKRLFKIMDSESDEEFPSMSQSIILDDDEPPIGKRRYSDKINEAGYLRINIRKTYARDGKLQAGKPGVIISQSTYKLILDHRRTLTTTIGTGSNLTIKLNKWSSIISTQRGMMIKSFDDNDRLLPDKCIGISSDMFRKLFFEMESDITQQPLISSDVLDEIQRLEDALTADGNDGGPVLERMVNIELEKEIPPALGETSIPSTSQQSEPTISRADISSDQPLTSSDVLSEIKRLEFDIDANRQPSLEKNGYH